MYGVPDVAKKVVIACISAHPKTPILLRAAASKARDTGADLVGLYVETDHHQSLHQESSDRVLQFLSMVEDWNGTTHTFQHTNVLGGILEYIENQFEAGNAVAHVVLGKPNREGLIEELRPSLSERVVKALLKLDTPVQVIPLSGQEYAPSWFDRLQLGEVKLKAIGLAVLAVLCALASVEIVYTGLTEFAIPFQFYHVDAFFLLATVIVAFRLGLMPGLVSSILSFLAINYFYVVPIHSLIVEQPADGVGLSVLLASAVIISLLGGYNNASRAALIRKEKRSQALYAVHSVVSDAKDRSSAMRILHQELSNLLDMDVAFFLPGTMNAKTVEAAFPADLELALADQESLQLCWQQVRSTGRGTNLFSDSEWRFVPMTTMNDEVAVLGVQIPEIVKLDPSFGRLLAALADQLANILERFELNRQMSESKMREEREKLRAMLLSSVSHDLKTPLASIIGSLSVYKRMLKSGRLKEDTSAELTDTALDEAQRLDSFISNILDMTRIESGDIEFSLDWVDPSDPVRSVLKRLRQRLKDHEIHFTEPREPVEVHMDEMITEQVLQNVIDNAAKYTPKGTQIDVSCGITKDGFALSIRDHGEGIPEENHKSIFDKYERLRKTDSQVAGTGLGLAISKAVMEKQGGSITVQNHPEGGAVFTLTFEDYRELEYAD